MTSYIRMPKIPTSATPRAGPVGADPFAFLHSGINVTLPRAVLLNAVHTALSSAWGGIELAASMCGFPFVVAAPSIVRVAVCSVVLLHVQASLACAHQWLLCAECACACACPGHAVPHRF